MKNVDLYGRAPRFTKRGELHYKGKVFAVGNGYEATVDGEKVGHFNQIISGFMNYSFRVISISSLVYELELTEIDNCSLLIDNGSWSLLMPGSCYHIEYLISLQVQLPYEKKYTSGDYVSIINK